MKTVEVVCEGRLSDALMGNATPVSLLFLFLEAAIKNSSCE
jgi:hypothetical protein